MGGGSYSSVDTRMRSVSANYAHKSIHEVFTQRSVNNAMDPHGVKIRESRDSDEHPESFPIIIALDETGSMGSTPHYFISKGFVNLMEKILQKGINDPQVLFLGIGDHECDDSPLQVSQFESNDELLEHWLKNVYLEGKGGGNDGETYHLAWYFAALHTVTDSFEKRGKKGVLITVGDEKDIPELPANTLKRIMGTKGYQHQSYTNDQLLALARKKYDCYHIIVGETSRGSERHMREYWKQLMGSDHVFIADRHQDVSVIAADLIIESYKESPKKLQLKDEPVTIEEIMDEPVTEDTDEEPMM